MANITKATATQIAQKLMNKKFEARLKLEEAFAKEIADLWDKDIPKQVKDFDKKFPGFLSKTSYVTLDGNGWSWKNIYVNREIIRKPGKTTILNLTGEDNKRLTKLNHDIQELKNQHSTLHSEIINTLMTLKSHKRIKESFPEAAELLPAEQTMALTVNLSELRNKIKTIP